MAKKHYILTTPQDVDAFTEDIRKSLDNTRIETVNEATFTSRNSARGLIQYRLPSKSGGSYGKQNQMRISHDPVGSMGISVGEVYNDHFSAPMVEWGTKPRIVYAKGKPMKIKEVIPPLGTAPGSRDINSVPYGTKYVPSDIEAFKIQHPGSRAFLIYTETFIRLKTRIKNIMRRAFRRNF